MGNFAGQLTAFMELTCHNCGATIPNEEINISTDLAKCTVCNSLHRASTLLEKVSVADLMTQPRDSRLQMQQGRYNSIELTLPTKGLTANAVFGIFFAIFWIGFVAVWTVLAAMGSPFFALFSLPFWFAGMVMAKGVITEITEVQKITFNNQEVTLETLRPIRPKKVVLDRKAIQEVKLQSALGASKLLKSFDKASKKGKTKLPNESPAIITPTKTYYIFESLSETEKQWVVRLLRQVLIGK